jgi:hypothetical protein
MKGNNPEFTLPYEITATGEGFDASTREFVLSVFPEASDDQIERVMWFTSGKVHDGITLGLSLRSEDPFESIDAYRIGRQEGHEEGYVLGLNDANNGGDE